MIIKRELLILLSFVSSLAFAPKARKAKSIWKNNVFQILNLLNQKYLRAGNRISSSTLIFVAKKYWILWFNISACLWMMPHVKAKSVAKDVWLLSKCLYYKLNTSGETEIILELYFALVFFQMWWSLSSLMVLLLPPHPPTRLSAFQVSDDHSQSPAALPAVVRLWGCL